MHVQIEKRQKTHDFDEFFSGEARVRMCLGKPAPRTEEPVRC